MLQKLAVAVEVALGRFDVSDGLDDEVALWRAGVRDDPPQHAGRDHQVVAGSVAQQAELRFQHPFAVVDEEHVVASAVFVPVIHCPVGSRHVEHHVAVAGNWNPRFHCIAARRRAFCAQMAMAQRALLLVLDVITPQHLHALHAGWRIQVVQNRLDAREPVDAHHFLVMQRSVGFAELRVAFVRQVAQTIVVRHRILLFQIFSVSAVNP